MVATIIAWALFALIGGGVLIGGAAFVLFCFVILGKLYTG